jgi:hypothetical protein
MTTLRPFAAAVFLCGAIVVAASARQQAPTAQSAAGEPAPPSQTSPDGPSPRNANYEIDARLDDEAKSITARETIRWRNITDQPTSELQFHLYWNAWRDQESTWLRERRMAGLFRPPPADAWSFMDVTALRLRDSAGDMRDATKEMRFIAPDDGNARDRTVMSVPLGRSVGPNQEVEIELEWTAKIPRPFARTGWVGDYYFIAQWFPKLGVLESQGWNTHQFHAATEFYSDFGLYDVRLTLPRRFVVGASGQQTARTDNGDGTTTHRYQGEDIHDFAWTASPSFVDLSQRFESPTLPPVLIRLLLQSERRGQADRYFAIVSATLQRYGEWFGAYPYPNLTVVDPAFQSDSDGMEYPTLVTGRSRWLTPASSQTPEGTTAHEVGHQWWYGMVATNEFEHAWMDEGFNTYATARVLAEAKNPNRVESRYFGGFIPWSFRDIPFTRVDNDRLAGSRGIDSTLRPTRRGHRPSSTGRRRLPSSAITRQRCYSTHSNSGSDGQRCRRFSASTSSAGSSSTRSLPTSSTSCARSPARVTTGSSMRSIAARTPSTTVCRSSAASDSTTRRSPRPSLSVVTVRPRSRWTS